MRISRLPPSPPASPGRQQGEERQPPCALCGRPLGRDVEQHHLVPRSHGGRQTVPMHPICHRKIHAVFSEKALADEFHTIPALRGHPEIDRFIKWLSGKPADFHKRTDRQVDRRV